MKFACILAAMVSALCLSGCGNQRFDKELWQARDGHYPHRKAMTKDLMENHLHTGMTYDDALGLLGGGDYATNSGQLEIAYEVDVRYFGIDPVGGENLILTFSADSTLTSCRLDKWAK